MVSGICTPEAFLQAMRDKYEGDEEDSWEIVSLLDQYYRRGKIQPDLFQMLKRRLENSALDAEERPILRPQPQPDAPPAPAARADAPRPQPAAVPGSPATRPPFAVPRSQPTAQSGTAAQPAATAPPTVAAPAAATRPPPEPVRLVEPVYLSEPVYVAEPVRIVPPVSGDRREIAAGSVLRDRYRLLTALGSGPGGTVFEALDEYRLDLPSIGQSVAIKVLDSEVVQRDELLVDAQRQFQHMQMLSHPNILRVHEFERDGGVSFLTMELLRGMPLSRVLSSRNGVALPRAFALAIMRDVGAALAYAHSRGVLHGDISPHNVFITNDGELRVMDFELSYKQLQERWLEDVELSKRAPVAAPGYASCQVLSGQSPDSRDDLFAFACLSYVLLSGKHPFPNLSSIEAYAQEFKPQRPPRLNSRQWSILREGLHWERERRPADVGEWLSRFELTGAAPRLPSLTALVDSTPPRGRTLLLSLSAALLLAIAGGLGYWAVTDYDSLSQHVADWTSYVRTKFAGGGASPTPPPAVPEPQPPAADTPPPAAAVPVTPPPTRAPSPPAPVSAAAPPAAATPIPAVKKSSPSLGTSGNITEPAARAESPAGGATRIELASGTLDVPASATTAHVTVRRTGSTHGAVAFSWWTESGTAKPSEDFAPIVPRVERFQDGQSSLSLSVPLSSTPRTQAKSFYVLIDRPDDSAAPLGKRTMTMVTLLPGG
jgi:serine/threonine protein kinase